MSLSSPFGRYWLQEKIATGGMAEIFKAKLVGVEGFEKRVVIKRILPFWSERRDFISMLVDEAKVLVHLNHPNIVQVYELGRVGPIYFIAMEYVEGRDLRQLVQALAAGGREVPQEMALSILAECLKGLHYAHERTLYDRGNLGIVHRDISPQNILLSMEGEVKISDFGIAKAVTQTHETQTGVLKGKYAYMSPEQSLGRALDRRSDLFSMGIVLYEILMGHRLFAGGSDLETLERVRKAEIPWPEAETAKLLPGLREVLEKALARERDQRFQTAEEFAEALATCLPGGKKVGTAQRANFFHEVFAQDFSKREIENAKGHQAPPGRQTIVSHEGGDTVSLVEAPSQIMAKSGQDRPLAVPIPSSRAARVLPLVLGLIWLGAAIGLAWWLVPQLRKAPMETPSSVPPIAIPSSASPSVPLPTEPMVPPNLKVAPEGRDVKKDTPAQKKVLQTGSLRVNANPWGRVSIAGLIGGQETPVVRSNVKVGVYSVIVSNPSVGKTVSTQMNVRPDTTTVCTADFEGNARIRCR
jgi:serine/threonine protein kinase